MMSVIVPKSQPHESALRSEQMTDVICSERTSNCVRPFAEPLFLPFVRAPATAQLLAACFLMQHAVACIPFLSMYSPSPACTVFLVSCLCLLTKQIASSHAKTGTTSTVRMLANQQANMHASSTCQGGCCGVLRGRIRAIAASKGMQSFKLWLLGTEYVAWNGRVVARHTTGGWLGGCTMSACYACDVIRTCHAYGAG